MFVAVLLIIPWLFIDPSPKSYGDLMASLVSGGSGRCEEFLDYETSICDVEIDPGSGTGARYLLHREGERCWSAIHLTLNGKASRPDWVREGVRAFGAPIQGCVTFLKKSNPVSCEGHAWLGQVRACPVPTVSLEKPSLVPGSYSTGITITLRRSYFWIRRGPGQWLTSPFSAPWQELGCDPP